MSKKLRTYDIFKQDSIAVFTDASYSSFDHRACAGAVLVNYQYDTIYFDTILSDINIHRAELYAIILGLREALKFNVRNINVFSDSLNSVRALRYWIIKWSRKCEKYSIGDKFPLYSSNRNSIDDDLYVELINLIVNNSHININIFHQRSHISLNNSKKVIDSFSKYNEGIKIDQLMVNILKTYNDMVDYCTRNNLFLSTIVKRRTSYHKQFLIPHVDKQQMNKYKHLIKLSY